jgi:hypothetical protein
MQRRALILGGVAIGALIAGYMALDALMVTDEEKLEQFVEQTTGTLTDDKIQKALSWVDLTFQPLEASYHGQSWNYGPGDSERLEAAARGTLGPYSGMKLALLSRQINVQGSTARVEVELFTRRGRVSATYDFQKHEERWLLGRIAVR